MPNVKEATLRIVRIEAYEFHRRLDGASWNPAGIWHERRAPLLRLVADDGSAGIGEGWSNQAEIGGFFDHLYSVAGWLLAQRCHDIGAISEALAVTASLPGWAAPAVASTVDMALWDLRARHARQTVYTTLGGSDGWVPVYASGGLYGTGKDAASAGAEMRGYAARGFTSVKMKIGGMTLEADLARVAAVRDAVGPAVAIMVDAVEQLTRETAPRWIDALAGLGVHAIQAPLPSHDVAGMAELQARGPLAVVVQEREYRPAAFRALLDQRAVGMLQFCPGLAGGFTGGLALVAMAQEAGIPVTVQCHGTAVLQAAGFHLGAGRPGVHSVEYHQFHDHLHGALPTPMVTVLGGRLELGEQPGAGIEPNLLDQPSPGPGSIRPIFRLPD